MITYVNTVLVGNLGSSELWAPTSGHLEPETTDAGKFVVMTMDENGGVSVSGTKTPYLDATAAASAKTMRIGIVTNKTIAKVGTNGVTSQVPVIKWSAVIKNDAIKSYTNENYAADTQDIVYINFKGLSSALLGKLDDGGKRIIVRITYKDLPTRYRKWTESYEYVTKAGDTEKSIAQNIANMINKEWKRARIVATPMQASAATTAATFSAGDSTSQDSIKLQALPYDDDNAVDTLNWANQVRFNVNLYYTDPEADGWASKNKNFLDGVIITKVPGKMYVGSAKLVRDREAQAMGYDGILNRGEGTWPIIKPDMATVLTNQYKTMIIEFENMYRAADDIQRHTKQTLEIYAVANSGLKAVVDAFIGGPIKALDTRVTTIENNA